MSRDLKFEQLRIHRFLGFRPEDGFAVGDLSPGINVIYGPNGSGKTTIGKAILLLLWPERSLSDCHIQGQFTLGEDEWSVENIAGEYTFRRNGSSVGSLPEAFPSGDLKEGYYLALHDLIQKDTTNQSFADIIAMESAGGYDIQALEDELDFNTRPSNAGRDTDRRVNNASKELKKLEEEVQNLHQKDSNYLPQLRAQLKDAKEARKRRDLVNDVIEYKQHHDELKDAQDVLQGFPDVLGHLVGDERDRLKDITSDISRAEEKQEDAEGAIRMAGQCLREADLPDGGVSEGTIQEFNERVDRLEKVEEQRQSINREIDEQTTIKEEALARLEGQVDEDRIRELGASGIDNLIEFSRQAEEVRSKLNAFNQLQSWFKEEENPQAKLAEMREGKSYLESWLQAGARQDFGIFDAKAMKALGFLHGVTAALLGLFVNPLFSLLAVPAGIFLWLGWREWGETSKRRSSRERYAELSLTEPLHWEVDSVRKKVRELSQVESRMVVADEREKLLSVKQKEAARFQKKYEALKQKKRDLVSKYGLAPQIDEAKLYWLIQRIDQYHQADEKLQGLVSKKENLQVSLEEQRTKLSGKLSAYGYDCDGDSSAFRGYVRDLDQRREQLARASDRFKAEEKRREEAKKRLEDLKRKRQELFDRLNLDVGDEARLVEYCEQLEDYKKISREVERQKAVCESKFSDLRTNEDFDEELLNREADELRQEMRELSLRAEEREEIEKEINRIEERVRQQKKKEKIEMARTRLERARDKLKSQLFSDYDSLVGDVLLDYLREEGFRKTRPQVFERSKEIFTRITKGNYQLEFGGEGTHSFKAVDTRSGEWKNLNELSSGTQIQLLLSVRMGFVECQEKGIKPPLVMDEVLANTDDVKASEIMDVAMEFSREGRQVFYMTAQGDEVAKWRSRLKSSDSLSSKFVDLGKVRRLEKSVTIPNQLSYEFPGQKLPRPQGRDHQNYGEIIGVPHFDPRRGPGSAHLWYIIETPQTLYSLLNAGIETWGQLKTLIESNAQILDGLGKKELNSIWQLGVALEEYSEGWEVGRNRQVDRKVIEASGAVTENFIEDVMDLVEACKGDPEKIIDGLNQGKVSGFRSSKIDELESYFLQKKYISPEDQLTESELKTRMLASITDPQLADAGKLIRSLFNRLRLD